MAITVTEKEHFQSRLKMRATELYADILNSDTHWSRDLAAQAISLVEDNYGVKDMLAELVLWRRRKRKVTDKLARLETAFAAHMRGLQPDSINVTSSGHNSYTRWNGGQISLELPDAFTDDDFKQYPGMAQNIMQEHARFEFRRLLKMHPVGQRLTKLRDQYHEFNDRLLGCASHAQLATIWHQLAETFNLIMEETQERQTRKIETARNKTTKVGS